MKTTFLAQVGVCALATTLLMVGCNPGGQSHVASASTRMPSAAKAAAQFAAMGETAMRNRNGVLAVALTERAVASRPEDARYRAQLGQAYLLAGRFASAIDAFRDAAALAPDDGRVLLGMALAQGALDRHEAAQASVAAASGKIGEADRGLALALAGESDAAVAVLERAARAADATAKTRQNLALAYALGGRWDMARTTAAQDIPASDVDARIASWAGLAKPQARVDRIAAFLGVTPAASDEGMPMALALGASPATQTAAAPIEQMPAARIVQEPAIAIADAAPTVMPESQTAPVQMAEAPVLPPLLTPVPRLVDRRPAPARVQTPVILAAPAPVRARPAAPVMLMRATYVAPAPKRGPWAVQLGAFSSGHSIEAAWAKVRRTVRPVAGMMPLSSTVRVRGRMFQRLAVGGIGTRAEAVALCERVRTFNGVCFVRTRNDEAPVRMVSGSPTLRVAMRRSPFSPS